MSTRGSIQSFIPTLPLRGPINQPNLAKELGVQNLPGVRPSATPAVQQTAGTGSAQPVSFSNILQNAVSQVDGKMQSAEIEQGKLLTGETSNLHQSVIAMQEATTSFSLMVQVRNKLVDSYQELMKMQV